MRRTCRGLCTLMKKGAGFVYPAGGLSSRHAKRETGRVPLQFERVSSPRKRKRSPESPDKTHPMPVEEQQTDYEADDYLDELGTAALEQYELTQRPPLVADVHSPSSSTQTHWLTSDPIVVAGQSEASAVPHESKQMVWKGKGRKQPSGELVGEVRALQDELSKEVCKVRELEEKGYEKDGEVKLLRSELRKKDDQLRELHARLVSQQKEKDEQFTREAKSLSTQLEFKDQELAALRERCSTLEQRNKQPSASHTSPIPHSRPPRRNAPGEGATRSSQKDSDFLSTETFMPLSQMSSSDVTPVHVSRASKTGPHASDGKSVSPETSNVKHRTHVHTASQTPSIIGDKGKSVEGQHCIVDQSAEVPSKAGQSSTSKPQKASQPSAPPSGSKTAASSSSDFEIDEKPIFISVPPPEVSSRDLLMLLSHRDLLETPSFDDNEDESTVDHSRSQNSLHSTTSGLPGLFSLLHIPHSSSSSPVFSACGMTTPIASSKFNSMTPPSAGTSMSVPSLELSTDSLPQTPIRKTKLQLHKPHTCARTDMIRSRTRAAPDDFPLRKTMSASNTPTRTSTIPTDDTDETPVSHTLLKSINVGSLQGSILSLLREEESSTVSSFLNQSGRSRSVSQFSSSSALLYSAIQDSFTSQGDDVRVEIRLLLDLGDIVCRYVTEQTEKARASTMSNSNASFSDLDSLDTQSPRSSAGSSSTSSRSNSDLNQPSRADQSVVYQSLSILDTLLTYSRQAREQLTAPPPPEFLLEDEISTALESKLEKAQRVSQKSREGEERMEEEGETEDSEGFEEISGTFKPKTIMWKGKKLEQLGTGKLSKVWIPYTEEPQGKSLPMQAPGWRRRSGSVPFSVTPFRSGVGEKVTRGRRRENDSGGRRGRQLLSSLLRLVSPYWRESDEIILLCLKILCTVAEDCPPEHLVRFSSLLDRDGLDGYLAETTDPSICLTSLTLLTSLVRSPQLIRRLCSQGATTEGCLLLICYEYFTQSVTEDSVMTRKIRRQVIQLVCNITMVTGGPAILFESSCSCCQELLKSVVTLIQYLVQDVHCGEDLSKPSILLLCSLIALLHKISLTDHYFDSHREACKYPFTYSLRSLKLLFKNHPHVNSTTKYILSDLYLEFCEELDESTDSSEDGEAQMTE